MFVRNHSIVCGCTSFKFAASKPAIKNNELLQTICTGLESLQYFSPMISKNSVLGKNSSIPRYFKAN